MKIQSNRLPIDGEPYHTADFSADSLQRIDEVCTTFEKGWRAGTAPSIESCLHGFDGDLRTALFAELLFLDIEYRMGDGQTPDPADYETRFPGDTPVIESAFKCVEDAELGVSLRDQAIQLAPFSELSLTSRFQLRQFHAQGGLGVVYVAHDETLDRDVAVKFSRSRVKDSTEQQRLSREAEITGRLEHPGIVPVYATGSTDAGFPCYIMQLIAGQSLHAAIREFHVTLPPHSSGNPFQARAFRQLLQSFIAVCNTVAYAHEHNVIHRDIKPSNIMLGRFGETFLLDWGLAKVMDGETRQIGEISNQTEQAASSAPESTATGTRPGQRLGTPAYASPEQVSGNVARHNELSDIYSLGATLYCLLVGKGPIEPTDLTSVHSVHRLKEITKPREIIRNVPRELEAICRKAMAFEPSDRYESAQHLAQDLERYLADEPIDVLSDSWIRKVSRWGRKHPRVVAITATTILVTTFSLAVGSYILGHNNRLLAKSNNALSASQSAQKLAQSETMSALRTLTDEVIQRWLAKEEELSPEDRDFVESILTRYQSFADSRENEIDALETRVEGFLRVGQLQHLLDNKPEAIAAWEAGLKLLSDKHVETPSKIIQNLQSRMQSSLGVAVAEYGDRPRGEALIKQAVAAEFELLQGNPDAVEYRHECAQRLDQLGNVYFQGGEYSNAVKQFRESLNLLADSAVPDPNGAVWLRKLQAGTHHNLGLALSQMSDYEPAVTELELSLQLHRAIVAQSSRINYRVDLARVLSTLGMAYRNLKQYNLARSSFAEAIATLTEITTVYPSLAEPLSLLGTAHQGLAGVHYDLREHEPALSECETAISFNDAALKKSPDEIEFRRRSSQIYSMQGAVCERLQQPDAAERYYLDSLHVSEDLFEVDSQFQHRLRLVQLLKALGNLQFQQRKFDEAGDYLERAILLVEELDDSPDRQRILFDEVGCHQVLGWSLMFSGQLEAAAGHWQRVMDATENHPIVLQGEDMGQSASVFRALCIARTKPSESLELVVTLANNANLVPSQIYNLACAAAMASQYLDSDTDKLSAEKNAFELLEQSVKAGMFADRGALNRLKGNPSFKKLFDHEEFKRIESLITSSLEKAIE